MQPRRSMPDLKKDWDEFYKVWTSGEVQDVVEVDMQDWCQEQAIKVHRVWLSRT